jgi:endonuclease/exonuclease/phosphatase family metal-dependent hydrolase
MKKDKWLHIHCNDRWLLSLFLFIISSSVFSPARAQFTLVELNCENLFDVSHDSLKQDQEYLPDATRHWTSKRYWRKLNNLGQEILSCREDGIPDLVALCEVENDSALTYLTRRSLLRNAGYQYFMTSSPDLRGIDVALLYSPFSFSPVQWQSLRVTPVEGMRPTRDILYVSGRILTGDTLHVFVVHAPSRYGGERHSRPFRLAVADRLGQAVDSIFALSPEALVVVAGDFNDYDGSPILRRLSDHRLQSVTRDARGQNGVRGTYRYRGDWQSIDHVLCSPSLSLQVDTAFIHSPLFLLEDESVYGGLRPRRTYNGMRYQPGYSDHLPLVVRFRLNTD